MYNIYHKIYKDCQQPLVCDRSLKLKPTNMDIGADADASIREWNIQILILIYQPIYTKIRIPMMSYSKTFIEM